MEEEEINENLDDNSPEKISKENQKKITSNENILKNSDSSTGDLIAKINQEANALNGEINSSNLKVFEKYHNLSIKELKILLSQKNENILSLNEQKAKYKKILNEIIKNLNNVIRRNSDFLNGESASQELILNLQRIKEEKTKEFENSKKYNKLYKSQLMNIKDKFSYGEEGKKKISPIEVKINNLKKQNILIKKEINDIRIDKLKHKKEYELVTDNKVFTHNVKIKTEEMDSFTAQKQGYYNKFNMSLKSLDNVIKEVKRFEEIYNASINEEMDEYLVKKINFWMNLIKSDLLGEKSEILSRIESGQSLFLKKIMSKNELFEKYGTNPTNNNTNINNISNINNNEKTNINNENDLTNKENIEKNETILNQNNSLINSSNINTNANNIDTIEGQSKLFKNRIIINKNKSSSLILSNHNKGNNSVKTRRDKINFYMKNNGAINSTGIFNYNLEYKTLFRKLNYLKFKSPLNGSMKLKLTYNNNLHNNSKSNYNLIQEEKYINDYFLEKNIKSHPNILGNSEEFILDNILTKDYNQISNDEYRQLLKKKDQYLQQNLRLEKNIEDIQKIKSKKLANALNEIEENYNTLENLKSRNNLLKKEIQNLSKVEMLRYEQAKLESEIQPKRPNIKKVKIKVAQNLSQEKLKKIIENENYKKRLKELKKNKIDYFDEVFRKNKKIKNSNSGSKPKVSIEKEEDRETKLNKIKEKYKKRDYEDSKDEINDKKKEVEKLNPQSVENKDNKENIINNNDINNFSPENKENSDENKEQIQTQNIN